MSSSSILKGILQNRSTYNYPAVRFGRVPKREKAKILAAMQSSRMKTQESKVMGELNDDAKIIDCIVRAHYDTCDYTRKKMDPFLQSAKANPKYISCSGTTCPMKGRPEDTFLEQFSERFMDHVRQVCTFAKLIPGFKCLHHDDQVTLLKSCVFEVLLVRLAGLFDSQSLVCLNGDIIRKDTINAMVPGNAKFLMDSVFELAQRLNHFRLSDAEIGLFCAVVIITPDRPGLRNPELLMRMQNKLKLVLSSILLPQHPENESIFPELMTMVHDLRTLNTLHTEKFLQQCKIDNGPPPPTSANSENNNSAFEAVSHQRWDSAHLDRESTGNGSPQSSSGGDTHSSTSLEDTSSRRSPMGSVSSTDSSTSEVSKLLSTVQDLRMNSNSVLMTALTSQPGGVTISRKTSNGQALTTHCPMAATVSTVSVTSANVNSNLNKYNNKMPTSTPQLTHPASMVRKTDSPSTDSGVESNLVLHPTSSTNNSSLCSSPRSSSEGSSSNSSNNNSSSSSSVENSKSRSNASASPPSEERHPLLKRALQQPPQMFNNVNTFQDEVYKPHKKFRRHNNSFSKDDCPSSSTQRSSSPEAPKSLLASQLAEPPQPYHPARSSSSSSGSGSTSAAVIPNLGNAAVLHQIHHHHPPISVPASSSLLASTLSQGIPLATSEESKRNELLAQLILGDNSGGPKRIAGAAATTPTEAAVAAAAGAQRRAYQQTQPQGLLMCAATNWSSSKNKAGAASSVSATPPPASYSQQPNRHIPVATLPTKPHGSSRMQASATVTSAEAAAMQPLNLSKRIESKTHHLMTAAAASMSASNHATAGGSMPPTSVAAATTAASNGHDIPTEA